MRRIDQAVGGTIPATRLFVGRVVRVFSSWISCVDSTAKMTTKKRRSSKRMNKNKTPEHKKSGLEPAFFVKCAR